MKQWQKKEVKNLKNVMIFFFYFIKVCFVFSLDTVNIYAQYMYVWAAN